MEINKKSVVVKCRTFLYLITNSKFWMGKYPGIIAAFAFKIYFFVYGQLVFMAAPVVSLPDPSGYHIFL